MKYSCAETEEKLSDYLDDLLNEEERRAIIDHIDTCESCANEYSMLCALVSELNTLPTEPLPFDFKENLHKRLIEEGMPRNQKYFSRNWKRYSVLVAGLLLVVMVKTGYYDNVSERAYIDDAVLEYSSEKVTQKDVIPIPTQVPSENEKHDNNDAVAIYKAPKKTEQASSQSSRRQDYTEDNVSTEGVPESTTEVIISSDEKQEEVKTPKPKQDIKMAIVAPEMSIMQEEPKGKIASPENSAVMFDIQSDETADAYSGGGGSSGADKAIAPSPTPAQKSFSSRYRQSDTHAPSFESVIVKVDNFNEVSGIINVMNNTTTQNGSITLELDADKFKEVMDLLVNYGAEATKQEVSEPLTTNICVITSK